MSFQNMFGYKGLWSNWSEFDSDGPNNNTYSWLDRWGSEKHHNTGTFPVTEQQEESHNLEVG